MEEKVNLSVVAVDFSKLYIIQELQFYHVFTQF